MKHKVKRMQMGGMSAPRSMAGAGQTFYPDRQTGGGKPAPNLSEKIYPVRGISPSKPTPTTPIYAGPVNPTKDVGIRDDGSRSAKAAAAAKYAKTMADMKKGAQFRKDAMSGKLRATGRAPSQMTPPRKPPIPPIMAKSNGGVASSYRKAADGVASKGKTKGRMIKMAYGGKC